MLLLRKGRPPAINVPLGGGAFAMVRPATTFETDLAIAKAGELLAGLIDSGESASAAVAILGDEFGNADFTTPVWVNNAAQRVALLELGMLCIESWSGVGDEDENSIEFPTRETLALLLRNSATARRVGDAINGQVNIETAEKKD
jgi:hypothetical protein